MLVTDRKHRRDLEEGITLDRDEGNRPGHPRSTSLHWASPVGINFKEGQASVRGSCQSPSGQCLRILSDGASAPVLMEEQARPSGVGFSHSGFYRGIAVAGLRAGRDGHWPGLACRSCCSSTVSKSTTSIVGTQRTFAVQSPSIARTPSGIRTTGSMSMAGRSRSRHPYRHVGRTHGRACADRGQKSAASKGRRPGTCASGGGHAAPPGCST